MAIKKTQLYSSLWQGCDELRGGMDASQYKDYVLTLLFMKYVSDKYAGGGTIRIPEGGSFQDILALKGKPKIGEGINIIIRKLADANELVGIIDQADFNDSDKLGSGQEQVDRLSDLVSIFQGLNLKSNRAEDDDLLGDAYEYLMRHFATESGKSKGQFYTPAEVSRILAKVIGITKETKRDNTVYDPTCGSGSLLLKVADEAPNGITIYGQERDNATYAIARMNMFLHNYPTADIWHGNTLASPHFTNKEGGLETFDFVVANPPFSDKVWSHGVSTSQDPYNRFEYGIPPAKNGDYAFLLHVLKSLKSKGKAAVILPHGVLFRGNVEGGIRRNLIRQGYIKGIIGLPANLFYGTGIPACIIVLDKEYHQHRTGIFMVDASKGFMKDGNKNRLRSQDIHKIVDVFTKQIEVERYSRMVTLNEIEKHEYNLNIPRYVDSSEPEDLHDLTAHLNGGIPKADLDALAGYWKVFPSLRDTLFQMNGREGYAEALVESSQIKPTILQHVEFHAFSKRIMKIYQQWKKAHHDTLYGLNDKTKPKELIFNLSEDLLERYKKAELLSHYDVYQILMDYWADTMQDDVYIIVQDGWKAGGQIRLIVEDKNIRVKETPDLVINRKKYKADLIPPALIVARYFAHEQEAIYALEADRDTVAQELEELIEEHSGDEGLLCDAMNDKGKVTKASIKARMKEIEDDRELDDEWEVLSQCQIYMNQVTLMDGQIKDAQQELDESVMKQYPKLTVDEIKEMVIEDKWNAILSAAVAAEVERVTQQLANRLKMIEERYACPLPSITTEVKTLSIKVDKHLKKMGLTW